MMYWIILAIVFLTFACWRYIVGRLSHWKNLGVPQANIVDILKANFVVLARKKAAGDLMKESYKKLANERYIGSYQFLDPIVQINSPDLIKQIGVKDFDHFVDHRNVILDSNDTLWSKNLVSLRGEKWRHMRSKLSPSFTSSKMRFMFTLIAESAEKFAGYFVNDKKDANEVVEIEMKDAFTRYANDVIASSAFGISCDSMVNRENDFYVMGKQVISLSGFWLTIKFFLYMLCPSLMRILKIGFFPKKISTFFTGLVKETIKFREENKVVRPDMIHLLMEARKGKLKVDEKDDRQNDTGFATVQESDVIKPAENLDLTDDDITAQALIFFFAGFDTASTAMCFMAHELTVNPDVQQKLYEEIQSTLRQNDGKVTYEALLKMKYLDMVVSETLRKWPPAIGTDRVCVKPYTIKPERDHEKAMDLKVDDLIFIPTIGIHHDERHYPNPEKFDPERFSDENRKNIDPYAYLPFGVGPRACIGSRFALLEIKAVFFQLLKKFEFVVTEKTPIPMVLSTEAFNLSAKGGFWIGLKLRQ